MIQLQLFDAGVEPAAGRFDASVRPRVEVTKMDRKLAERFRNYAATARKQAEKRRNTSLKDVRPTPRRQRMIDQALRDAHNLERLAVVLEWLADQREAGTLPHELRSLKTKKIVDELVNYASFGWLTDPIKYGITRENYERIRGMLLAVADGVKNKDDMSDYEVKLLIGKIPGFFPTPRSLIEHLLEDLVMIYGPQPEDAKVLEPCAGAGDMILALRELRPEWTVHGYEINYQLVELAQKRDVNLRLADFMRTPPRAEYDVVIMNPPFERGEAIRFAQRAFAWLKPGGVLASIGPLGVQFRSDKLHAAFRDWLAAREGHIFENPAKSFAPFTDVATVRFYLRKER